MNPSTSGITVPITEKVQTKILSGQYIDFAELLPTNLNLSDNQNLRIVETASGLALLPQEPPKKKGDLNEIEWNKAFHMFSHIHGKRWPDEQSQLNVYGMHINNMMMG